MEAADIIPDDVDADTLHSRQRQRSSTDPAERDTCPDCGTPEIFTRTEKPTANPHDDHNYRCTKCGHRFDTPARGIGGDT